MQGKGALVSCSCRGYGTSGGLGFLPLSLCPCGLSVSFLVSCPIISTFSSPIKRSYFCGLHGRCVCVCERHCVIRIEATRGGGGADTGAMKRCGGWKKQQQEHLREK